MKKETKSDAFMAILVLASLTVLGTVVYIASVLTGLVGYPLGTAEAFIGVIGAVLVIAGGGLVLYPTDRTTAVGIAVLVIGGVLLVQLLATLMA